MKKIKLTVAQALVKFLTNQYICVDGQQEKFVEGIMGIFGHGNVVGLGQALEQYKDELTYIQGKNEQDIAHACTAFAKQNRRRRIFACTASIGPGSLNMVTAAGTATANRIPILLLPSDTFSDRQPDPVLQQMEDETDATVTVNDAFRPVSKYWDRIYRPEQLMKALLNAFRVLTDPAQTGAVTLCLPQDVQGESYEYPQHFFEKRVWYLDRTPAADEVVVRAANAIRQSKKPFMIVGGGVRYSDAGKEVLEFAKAFKIPFGETQAGKGEIAYCNEEHMGAVGVCGALSANLMAAQADLIIAVGTKLNDFVTASKSAFSMDAKFVGININRMDSLKMDGVSVVCDAKEGIQAIHSALRREGYCSGYQEEYKHAKAKWNEELLTLSKSTVPGGLSQTRVLMELNQLMGKDDIILAASGSMPSDLERLWDTAAPGCYHVEYGFSCMGYEIGGALGVKLAEPQKNVYAFLGDGVFLMAHSELVTTIQEQKKITIVLFDNSGHQCIHNLQRSQGIDSFGTEFRYREKETNGLTGSYVPVDYAKIAQAYGAKSYKVKTIDELKQAVEAAREESGTVLIEIKVLPGTMTEGYESFWRVGTATVALKKSVEQAGQKMHDKVSTLRKY